MEIWIPTIKTMFANLLTEYGSAAKLDLSGLSLSILEDHTKVIGPRTTATNVQIHLKFLEFLWCYTYGIIAKTPASGKTIADDKLGDNVLAHALKSLYVYTEWDQKVMPNPEAQKEESDSRFVGKANAVFLCAVRFIILHEFAHIIKGHFKTPTTMTRSEMELEADAFAADCTANLIRYDRSTEFTAISGLVIAMLSISFTSIRAGGGMIHPDPDNRIAIVLDRCGLPDRHNAWMVAIWGYFEWEVKFHSMIRTLPDLMGGNLRQAFAELRRRLQEVKLERSIRAPFMKRNYVNGQAVKFLLSEQTVTVSCRLLENPEFEIYQVHHENGTIVCVTNEDIVEIDDPLLVKVAAWKEEMKLQKKRAMVIGLDESNAMRPFYYDDSYEPLKAKHPNIRFKWVWTGSMYKGID